MRRYLDSCPNKRCPNKQSRAVLTSVTSVALFIASLVFSPGSLMAKETKVSEEANGKQDKRPNILFIMSDDHGYQAIGAYGSRVNETPNLDRIANQGMRFDRAFVTNSICGPCRAVILTGKYSHLNGFAQNGDRFNGEQQTVAKLLQKAGYQTAMVGKWHLESDPTGFDYWHVLQGQGPYYNPRMLTSNGPVEHTGYTTDIITDVALDWLKEKRDPNKPFFLMYHHKAPHRNWQPGPKHLTTYDDVEIPEPDTLFDDYEGRGTAAKTQAMTVAEHLNPHDLKLSKQNARFTPEQEKAWKAAYDPKNEALAAANLTGDDLIRWKYQRYAKDYLRCVASVDDNVGRVLDYLDDTGLAENTIVFYTSDQGWYLGEHGWYDKRWMYEESFRTPLMIRWPGHIKPGTTNDDMVMNLDFAETFLDVAGAEIPDDMQGESLVPILEGNTPEDWRNSVYYHYYEFPGPHSVRRHYGVRNDRYKLIYFYNLDEWELYDLEKDPQEMRSVYDVPEYADIVKQMKEELERLQKKYNDDGTVIDFNAERAKLVPFQEVFSWSEGEPSKVDGAAITEESTNKNNPAYKPISVGGFINSTSDDGVIIAQGGNAHGYALTLEQGKPCFLLRSNGQLHKVTGPKIENDKWVHVVAQIDQDGMCQLILDGQRIGQPQETGFVRSKPADGLSVGEDTGSPVGEYEQSPRFQGQLKDIRVFWGPLGEGVQRVWEQPDSRVSLFDGKSLKGWKVIDKSYFEDHGNVQVLNGQLVLERGEPGTGIVVDREVPKINYEVSLDAQRTFGDDFFCGLTFPVNDNFLTLIVGGWGGGTVGISNLNGMSAIENETTSFGQFEYDRWYNIRLKVTDKEIAAWIDNKSMFTIETDLHKHTIWWEQEPARPLGIVTWNTSAKFRNLTLDTLESESQ